MKKSITKDILRPLAIEFKQFGCNVFFVHCSYPELVRLVNEQDPSVDITDLNEATGGAIGNLLWVNDSVPKNTIPFVANVCHEAVHLIDMIMDNLGLEGTEVRAYCVDYTVATVLEHVGLDKVLAA